MRNTKLKKIRKFPLNDNTCGWIQTLEPRTKPIKELEGDLNTDFLIVGAGFTGLALAHRLAELQPHSMIVLLDAQIAGEGATSRNSGFLVDSSQAAGEKLSIVRKSYELNISGISYLGELKERYGISCDWRKDGKIHATANRSRNKGLKQFAERMEILNFPYQILNQEQLQKRLGTDFYQFGIQTDESILIQPAALARGLVENLPENVKLIENSAALSYDLGTNPIVNCKHGRIQAGKTVFANNAFLRSSHIAKHRIFPMVLSASMTRVLTDREMDVLGNPDPWAVLSGHPFGATVRLTSQRRILIRNTADFWPEINMNGENLEKRIDRHQLALQRRFPKLENLTFEYSWSGAVCMSLNHNYIYQQLSKNAYAIGCYNGGGIAKGTMFGKTLAEELSGWESQYIDTLNNLEKPSVLPPQPFLYIGAKATIALHKLRVGTDL